MPGWDAPGFDAKAWQPVVVLDEFKAKLVAQPNEPIRVVEELKPVALTRTKTRRVGFRPGPEHGRLVSPGTRAASPAARSPSATPRCSTTTARSTPPTCAARRKWTATRCAAAEREFFEPHFTYHGFRFVELTGLASKPTTCGAHRPGLPLRPRLRSAGSSAPTRCSTSSGKTSSGPSAPT